MPEKITHYFYTVTLPSGGIKFFNNEDTAQDFLHVNHPNTGIPYVETIIYREEP